MKLRLKADSLRLRVTRSELARLQAYEAVEETVHFPGGQPQGLSYNLTLGPHGQPVQVAFTLQRITVSVSEAQLGIWSEEREVGIYASLPTQNGRSLEVAIEKDFACLDLSDAENADTFANPLAGRLC